MFDAISEDTQRKCLSRRNGLFFRGSVSHYTWHVHNLGNPASVSLKLSFDFIHNVRHARILPRGHFCGIKVWLDFPNITRRI